MKTYEARWGGAEVIVALTGMGQGFAQQVRQVMSQVSVDICITSGLAGGLKPKLRASQIIAGREVMDHDTSESILSDHALLARAECNGASVVGRMLTVREAARSRKEKHLLAVQGDAAEMESYWVMQSAAEAGIPALVLRAISDPFDRELPYDFHRAVNPSGQIGMGRLLGEIVRTPRRFPSLLRLGHESMKAARALALFLDRLIPDLVETGADRKESPLAGVAVG
jgi:adenosylhomocysteine nucleosidase